MLEGVLVVAVVVDVEVDVEVDVVVAVVVEVTRSPSEDKRGQMIESGVGQGDWDGLAMSEKQ